MGGRAGVSSNAAALGPQPKGRRSSRGGGSESWLVWPGQQAEGKREEVRLRGEWGPGGHREDSGSDPKWGEGSGAGE